MLLHNWTTVELAQIADVMHVLRDVLGFSICPSNGRVSEKFHRRFPNTRYQLLFNMQRDCLAPLLPGSMQQQSVAVHRHNGPQKYYAKYKPTAFHEPGDEGWGDDLSHYYVIEDMLKLDPEQILWLKDNAPFKAQVEAYIRDLGEWFDNNGETFGQTLEFVLTERGVDAEEFSSSIHDEHLGVAISGF